MIRSWTSGTAIGSSNASRRSSPSPITRVSCTTRRRSIRSRCGRSSRPPRRPSPSCTKVIIAFRTAEFLLSLTFFFTFQFGMSDPPRSPPPRALREFSISLFRVTSILSRRYESEAPRGTRSHDPRGFRSRYIRDNRILLIHVYFFLSLSLLPFLFADRTLGVSLWVPFQTAAGTVTSLYKGACVSILWCPIVNNNR